MKQKGIIYGFLTFLVLTSFVIGAGGKKKVVIVPANSDVNKMVYRIKFFRGILNLYSARTDSFLFKGELKQKEFHPIIETYESDNIQHIFLALEEYEGKDEEDFRFSVELRSLKIPTDNQWNLFCNGSMPSRYDISLGAVLGELKFNEYKISELFLESGASEVTLIFVKPNKEICDQLKIEVGAGKFTAKQLGNARARKIIYNAGVGKSELDFSGQPDINTEVFIQNGIGFVKLYVPKKVGAKFIKESGFLSSFDIDNVIKKGDIYYSLNYDQAPVKYIFHIENSLGTVEVFWIGDE